MCATGSIGSDAMSSISRAHSTSSVLSSATAPSYHTARPPDTYTDESGTQRNGTTTAAYQSAHYDNVVQNARYENVGGWGDTQAMNMESHRYDDLDSIDKQHSVCHTHRASNPVHTPHGLKRPLSAHTNTVRSSMPSLIQPRTMSLYDKPNVAHGTFKMSMPNLVLQRAPSMYDTPNFAQGTMKKTPLPPRADAKCLHMSGEQRAQQQARLQQLPERHEYETMGPFLSGHSKNVSSSTIGVFPVNFESELYDNNVGCEKTIPDNLSGTNMDNDTHRESPKNSSCPPHRRPSNRSVNRDICSMHEPSDMRLSTDSV